MDYVSFAGQLNIQRTADVPSLVVRTMEARAENDRIWKSVIRPLRQLASVRNRIEAGMDSEGERRK
jgi:hypothetical protein